MEEAAISFQPTILVTGFGPFLGAERNPSTEAVQRLPGELLGCQIIKRELPVVWFECVHLLEAYIKEFHLRTVLSVGQGYPTPPVLIERIGINLCNGPLRHEGIPALKRARSYFMLCHRRLYSQ